MASSKAPGMLVQTRKSLSSADGGRKEIPLTASLDLLKPEPSAEQSGLGEKPGAAGPVRSKTPVGCSAPPRRTISANRTPNVQLSHHQQPECLLPGDDSLVLYKDPSDISAQGSMASVVSGRHQEGETFFTALRRNYSFESESELDMLSAEGQPQATVGNLSIMSSQLNPMQSPNSSAYFSAAGDSEYASAAGSLQEEYSKAASMATCESSYTMCQETSSTAAGGALLPTSSVMDVINSLYCSQSSAAAGSQQRPKWHELDRDGLPLMQQPTAAPSACQPQPEPSCTSSVGSCDPAGEQQGQVGVSTAAAVTAKPASSENGEVQLHASHLLKRESIGQDDDVARLSVSSAESATSTVLVLAALPPAAESSDSSYQTSVSPGKEVQLSIEVDATQHAAAAAAAAAAVQEQLGPQADQQPQPAPAAADAETPDHMSAEQQEQHEQQEKQEQASSTAYLAQVEELLASRCQMQAELSGYIQDLTSRADEAGQQLLDMPADYALMVERMLRERRSQYRALEGWEGPHRFDDLPVAQLPTCHNDPRVAAGLEVIRQLDEQLKEAWLKALVASRGADPEQWAQAEVRRLEVRAAALEEGLAKERQRRLHAARLLRALKKLDEQGADDDDALMPWGKGLSSYSYYKLQPQEEQLLAVVLGRDEAALEQDNPFDASTACLDDGDGDDHGDSSPGQLGSASHSAQVTRQTSEAGVAPLLGSVQAAAWADVAAQLVSNDSSDPAAAGGVVNASAAGAAGAHASCKPSTAGSARSGSSTSSKPRRTLAEIDALLEALQAQHAGLQGQGQLSNIGSSSSNSSNSVAIDRRVSRQSAATSTVAAAGGVNQEGNQTGMPLHKSSSSLSAGGTQRGNSSIAGQPQQQRDYVREQREAKELLHREREIDAKLRALRTSELPSKLTAEQLQVLLECSLVQERMLSSAAGSGVCRWSAAGQQQ